MTFPSIVCHSNSLLSYVNSSTIHIRNNVIFCQLFSLTIFLILSHNLLQKSFFQNVLELRRLKSDLVLYYKGFHDLVTLPSSEYFTISNCTSQTRTGGDWLLRPLYSTKLYENDFFNRCVSCCNYLPPAVVNASSISCFKRLLSNVDLSPITHCTYF